MIGSADVDRFRGNEKDKFAWIRNEIINDRPVILAINMGGETHKGMGPDHYGVVEKTYYKKRFGEDTHGYCINLDWAGQREWIYTKGRSVDDGAWSAYRLTMIPEFRLVVEDETRGKSTVRGGQYISFQLDNLLQVLAA